MPPEDIDMEYQEQMNDEERELEEEMRDWVRVVRCKDCKWYDSDGEEMNTQGHCWYKNGDPVMQDMKPNDYCSYGERKEKCDG